MPFLVLFLGLTPNLLSVIETFEMGKNLISILYTHKWHKIPMHHLNMFSINPYLHNPSSTETWITLQLPKETPIFFWSSLGVQKLCGDVDNGYGTPRNSSTFEANVEHTLVVLVHNVRETIVVSSYQKR
jgi:hypothetical protein